MKKLSSLSFWLSIFVAIIAVQAYSTFAQSSTIVGSWNNGSVGAIQYQNQVTGATKSGRGSVFSYKFLADGNYEFVGYMEVSMYNCTTKLFNQITGKYKVAGSTITLDPSRDFWKNENTCAASSNKEQEKVPTKKMLQYQYKTDDYGNQMLCLTDGGTETCYRKEK